ncbi:MAG: SurA N-terminal domain-containing protein [Coriobacteriales bacterium]
MTSLKRALIVACAVALAVCGCFALAGCGKQAAATWAHGDVSEEDVTKTIENMRTNYGLTDDATWASFIAMKAYDSSANSDGQTTTDGTVADLRTYVINQLLKTDIIDYEVKEQNITVSDDELDAYVDQQRQAVESQYMAGVFESYLQKQGYKSLDEYKEQARKALAEQKLAEQNGASEDDESAWDSYVDGLMQNADIHINDMPSGLSCDVDLSSATATLSGNTSDATSSEGDATQDTSSTDSSSN